MDARDIYSQVVNGVAAGANMLVTDIQLYDALMIVQPLDTQKNIVDEFSVTADGVIANANTGTNTLGLVVLVVWNKNYKWRSQFEEGVSTAKQRIGRSPF